MGVTVTEEARTAQSTLTVTHDGSLDAYEIAAFLTQLIWDKTSGFQPAAWGDATARCIDRIEAS